MTASETTAQAAAASVDDAVSPGVTSSEADNLAPAASQPAGRGKNRFSLDALRLPFLASPRKVSTASVAAVDETAISEAPESDVASSSDNSAPKETRTPTPPQSHEFVPNVTTQQLAPPTEVLPKRSALTSSVDASARRASRTTSPHRVSFSPSTEETALAREEALAFAALASESSGKPSPPHDESHPLRAAKSKKKKSNPVKWRGFKSRSTSDLHNPTHRPSLDSVRTGTSDATSSSSHEAFEDRAALPGAAAAKRRLFRWDRKGIHRVAADGSRDKGKVAKVKVTKHQALAARHAKTLEQVINAGMGLHPVPARVSSARHATEVNSADANAKGGKKKHVPRAKPIPVVDRSQLRGLKSALLDVDLANNIISELRSMPVPLDALRSGLGRMMPETEIGTAGEHGQERILATNLPDTALEGPKSKDDSEIRKRAEAVAGELAAAPATKSAAERPPMERKARSAAEEALRKITLQADAATTPRSAVPTARTSSLPPPAEESISAAKPISQASASGAAAATPPAAKQASAKPGARPLKMVCLDCGEHEAHRRHADHLEAAKVVTSEGPSDAQTGAGLSVTAVASGAAAALMGVGGLLSARSQPSEPEKATSSEASSSARPPLIKSMSVSNLPTLEDGQRLMGSAPLQLILDPVGAVAQNSGAFDVLANVSGAAIRATQDMDAIHPPLDRMAIFVHWWGFEITLPKASMAYLGTAHSVSGAFLSFLQTMAVGGGVPELLPFIKYISTFMEVEYKAIQAQDQGHGVCIAGTWFMPLALVPRPWDYPLDGPAPVAPTPAPGAAPPPFLTREAAAQPEPAPKRHAFKKKPSLEAAKTASVQVAVLGNGAPPQHPVPPTRNLSPSQLAAIHTARTEKMAHDLSPHHSRSSSIASAKSAKLLADLGSANSAPAEAALASVQEMPEVGSLRITA